MMNETPTDRHHREWAEGLEQAAQDQRKGMRGIDPIAEARAIAAPRADQWTPEQLDAIARRSGATITMPDGTVYPSDKLAHSLPEMVFLSNPQPHSLFRDLFQKAQAEKARPRTDHEKRMDAQTKAAEECRVPWPGDTPVTMGIDLAGEDSDHTVTVRIERAPDMGEGVPAISGKVYQSDNLAPSKYRVHSTGEYEAARLDVDDPYLRKLPTIELVRELRRRKVLKPVNGAAVVNELTHKTYKGDPSFIRSTWHDVLLRLADFLSDPNHSERFVEKTTEKLDERGDSLPDHAPDHLAHSRRMTARIEVLDRSLIGRGW